MRTRSTWWASAGVVLVSCSGGGGSAATTTPSSTTVAVTAAPTTTAPETTAPAAGALTQQPCDAAPSLPPTTCYWLEVPAHHDVPGSPTIRLWVEVVTPSGTPPDALPMVWLSGGPGDSASAQIRYAVGAVGTARPLVFVDQRGTGRSEPRLDCHELDQVFIDPTAPWSERLAQLQGIARTCRGRLTAAGIDLAAFNIAEDVADVVDLRRALGYDRWLVYGISYGGRLAQQVLRRDEAAVAGVILDSSVPSEPLGAAWLAGLADDAIDRLAAACAAQPSCAGQVPDLRATIAAAVARLDATPYTSTARSSGGTPLVITGQEVVAGTFTAMYQRDLRAVLPGAAASIAAGDNSIVDALAEELARPSMSARGLLATSLCADDGAPSDADRAVLADPGEHGSLLLSWPYPVCEVWDVPPAPGGPLVAPTSDVPVLLFEGGLDPIAPPRFADLITAHLGHATVVVDPAGGHGNAFATTCTTGIADAFLADPTHPPDTSCVATLPPPFAP